MRIGYIKTSRIRFPLQPPPPPPRDVRPDIQHDVSSSETTYPPHPQLLFPLQSITSPGAEKDRSLGLGMVAKCPRTRGAYVKPPPTHPINHGAQTTADEGENALFFFIFFFLREKRASSTVVQPSTVAAVPPGSRVEIVPSVRSRAPESLPSSQSHSHPPTPGPSPRPTLTRRPDGGGLFCFHGARTLLVARPNVRPPFSALENPSDPE